MVTSTSVLPSFVRIETALGRELTPHPGTQLQRGRPPGGLEPPEHGRAGGGSRKAGSAEPWVQVGGEVRKLRKTRGRTARPPPPLGRAGRAAPRADGGPGAPTSPPAPPGTPTLLPRLRTRPRASARALGKVALDPAPETRQGCGSWPSPDTPLSLHAEAQREGHTQRRSDWCCEGSLPCPTFKTSSVMKSPSEILPYCQTVFF